MRKSAIILPALLLTTALHVGAIPGDPAGEVYTTDIKTYFFGREVNSYNIGGRTVVAAEDLMAFGGFEVVWNQAARKLIVNDTYSWRHGGTEDRAISEVNFPEGYYERKAPTNIYQTDIVTTYNTSEANLVMDSYNIGGQTCVVVEDLLKLGYSVVWDAEKRELRVDHIGEERRLETDLGEVYSDGRPEHSSDYYASTGRYEIINGEESTEVDIISFTPSIVTVGPVMAKLSDLGRITGLTYSFENDILTLDTTNAVSFTSKNKPGENLRRVEISELDSLYLEKLVVNGSEGEFEFEWSTMMGSQQHVREVGAIVFGGEVYVPLQSVKKLIDDTNHQETVETPETESAIPEE